MSRYRTPGRPSKFITIDLDDIDGSIQAIRESCNTDTQRSKLAQFQEKIKAINFSNESPAETVLNDVLSLNDDDLFWILENIWTNLKHDRAKNLFQLVTSLSQAEQCTFFAQIASIFNQALYNLSKIIHKSTIPMTLADLSRVSKASFIQQFDERLLAFLRELMEKSGRCNHHDITNELFNILDNILKGRNYTYLSPVAVREGTVCHISSGKSTHTNQVMAKKGGCGSKPVLERVIQNTVENRFGQQFGNM